MGILVSLIQINALLGAANLVLLIFVVGLLLGRR